MHPLRHALASHTPVSITQRASISRRNANLMETEEMEALADGGVVKIVTKTQFSRYQMFVVGMLAFLQFTIVLDFMIMAPLGAMMMPNLHVSPQQFGFAVSCY